MRLCVSVASAAACRAAGAAQQSRRGAPNDADHDAEARRNFHVLFGVGGNILVSIGANGVLIVDDQFPQMVPKYKATIGELGGGAVNFAINTHWHFDHADGNQVLGPEGTWLVAQENSRQMMTKNNVINLVSAKRDQPAYAETALPVLTYDDAMRFHFNGERIDLMHFGPAHTTGDTAVIFRGHKSRAHGRRVQQRRLSVHRRRQRRQLERRHRVLLEGARRDRLDVHRRAGPRSGRGCSGARRYVAMLTTIGTA